VLHDLTVLRPDTFVLRRPEDHVHHLGPVLVAVALDAALAEPPLRAHPVVWAGRYLDRMGRRLPAAPPGRAVATGGLAWAVGTVVAVVAGLAAEGLARQVPPGPGRSLARGAALWPLLSARMLLAEVAAVEAALRDGPAGGGPDVEAGRDALSRIVSRDTTGLTAAEVRAAALESLAENLSDSFVAPLCWYVLAGLPGAAAYRFVNTADATWGYRTPRWLHAGRVAARADDLANLLPARLTALLLLPRPGRWRALRGESLSGPGPNGGWPMAAIALWLDVRLSKRGHYVLHPAGADPTATDLERALAHTRRVALAATLLAAGAAAVRPAPTHTPTDGGDR
jgi:adenosylcobinamide-phosphate synthase